MLNENKQIVSICDIEYAIYFMHLLLVGLITALVGRMQREIHNLYCVPVQSVHTILTDINGNIYKIHTYNKIFWLSKKKSEKKNVQSDFME